MSFCKFTFCPFVENEVIGNLHGLEILSIGSFAGLEILSIGSFAGLEILSIGSSLLSGRNKWNDLEREEYDLGSLVHEQSMCIVSHPIRIFFFFVKTIEEIDSSICL